MRRAAKIGSDFLHSVHHEKSRYEYAADNLLFAISLQFIGDTKVGVMAIAQSIPVPNACCVTFYGLPNGEHDDNPAFR